MALTFEELQRQLRPEWGREHDGNGVDFDLLMLPSLSFEPEQMALVSGAHHYEERQLFSLIRLRDPGVRAVYVTSKLLPDLVVDSVLELLPVYPPPMPVDGCIFSMPTTRPIARSPKSF
jgi:hypothetical protein